MKKATLRCLPAAHLCLCLASGLAAPSIVVAQVPGKLPVQMGAEAPVAPRNVVQLSSSGAVEVAQDLLSITLSVSKEGSDASSVQSQIQKAIDAALNEARASVQAGAMDLRTGGFSVQPRYSREGRSNGWVGSAQVVLEGRDFPRIASVATRITTLTVAGVNFSVSRESRQQAEQQAQAQAIERFKARAQEISKGFGFQSFSLRELSVSGDEAGGFQFRSQMAAYAQNEPMAAAPLPVEAGKATVQVWVKGSVQLQ